MFEFLRDVLRSTAVVMARGELLIPAAIGSLICDGVIAWARWPFVPGAVIPTRGVVVAVVLMILARACFSLTLCNVALAAMRGHRASVADQWVPVTTALRAGIVTVALMVPIALGTLLLIIPGVILMLMWSQVLMLLIDDRARFFDAAGLSESVTASYRWQILVTWVVVACACAIVELAAGTIASAGGPGALPEPIAIGVSWSWNIVVSVLGIALSAALYGELLRRTPWEPATVR
jgi:hypothetical protein